MILKRGLQEQIRIFEGDFSDAKTFRLFPDQKLIYAVESLIHLPPETEIAPLIASSLAPGGRFLLCDDMLNTDRQELSPAGRRLLDEFSRYWYAPGIRSARDWIGLFERAGLHLLQDEDLSPWLRLFRPRDIAAAALVPLVRGVKNPWAANIVGGTALQRLLRRKRVAYRLLVFQKS